MSVSVEDENTHVRPVADSGAARARRVSDRWPRTSSLAPVSANSGSCLVIGETGASWSSGIATARRHGPNLSLVTQWAGEAPQHFSQRVISRLSKRTGFDAVVFVCNGDCTASMSEARQAILRSALNSLPSEQMPEVTLLCRPSSTGGLPQWAPRLVDEVLSRRSSVELNVALAS